MITLESVGKTYGSVTALHDVTLSVARGTIHGIVGPSGAGKSTLVGCLTGLVTPTSGRVVVDDVEVSAAHARSRRALRRRIGMVFQHVNLFDQRTAAKNIAYPLQIMRTPKGDIAKRVAELLEIVGLTGRGDSYPSQLSGGQKQRVGIARALATRPPVLLADEPTSALDTETTTSILQLLREVCDQLGVTIVIVTHEMSVVREICDSVTLLSAGEVAETGTLEEIISDKTSRLARALVPPPSIPDDGYLDGYTILDVMFTSHPGEPTGARVLSAVANLGGDIAAGTFETIGSAQVGRLAVSVPPDVAGEARDALWREGHAVQIRRENGVEVEL
ncbi:methionine ABC transporter ATP-binding protein [Bowdeniella massiliensis]|uniref:methionine ABC transporter ATP-binding protein n=1 Tax=Bowdeniella massiliensis TaxID=2932264 RepID=UPI002027ADC3